MIRFETINSQLCRMVEPTPLTPESQFPCVVRLIQDDSPMGRYNLRLRDTALEPLVVTGIEKDLGVVTHRVPRPHFSCECYEVIGYPVVDGSIEWALWQRQNKRSVITDTGVVMRYHYDDETCNALLRVYPTGWQLYEPNPLPMASTHDGLGDKFLRDCLKPNEHPIITGYNRLDYVPVEGIRIPVEPEPQPAYAVGDWVSDGVTQGCITYMEDGIIDVMINNGNIYTIEKCNLRKLNPSEVVVHIGCLSGTVKKRTKHDFWLGDPPGSACIISFAMLDEPTANLVKELLEKQGERK